MIARFKWATQRVTMILVVLIVLAIPFVMAKLGQLLGLWGGIDRLYPEQLVLFILLSIVSRAIYGLAWIGLSLLLINEGEEHGWFWFKHEPSYSDKPGVDKSGDILGALLIIAIVLGISEVAIRLSTATLPPWY